MNYIARPITKHHSARLTAWTLSMLLWLASVLMGAVFTPRHERQRAERMSLAYLTWRVKMIIVSRAAELLRRRGQRPITHSRTGRPLIRAGTLRALIGVRLTNFFKRKDLLDRIRVLVHALYHIDKFARTVARRLKRGLTRRRPKWIALAPDAPIPAFEECVVFADSS